MQVSSEDIAILAKLVAEEHGPDTEAHINQYIDTLKRDNDARAVDLWQKVAAIWFSNNRRGAG